MGKNNSSLTRVVPVFEALFAFDRSGEKWLPALLSQAAPLRNGSSPGLIEEGYGLWGKNEKPLGPPVSLLKCLVKKAKHRNDRALGKSEDTRQRRQKLVDGDVDTSAEALALLSGTNIPSSRWFVLEGLSRPDAFIKTSSAIIVIEGKRTERGMTRHTDWMPLRDQLLRHMDAAWELNDRGAREVLGLLIVEAASNSDTKVPKKWLAEITQTTSPQTVNESLPHRTDQVRAQIASGVLGVTTWQRICNEILLSDACLQPRNT